jgi:hypothetical protein
VRFIETVLFVLSLQIRHAGLSYSRELSPCCRRRVGRPQWKGRKCECKIVEGRFGVCMGSLEIKWREISLRAWDNGRG